MLTDVQVRKAEAGTKDYKLFDGRGLFVLVTRAGYKSWRYKYTLGGKEKLLVLGAYPDVSLREARDAADELTRSRRSGKDPALEAKRRKLAVRANEQTFEAMARQWHELEKARWRPVHAADVLASLERDIFPDLGPFPLSEIDHPLLLTVLQKVERRGAIETAHRLRQRCEAIFHLATSLGIGNSNPAAGLGRALKKKPVKKRWPALIDIQEVRVMLRDSDTAGASPIVRAASRMLALTAQRPGMIRRMRWSQVTGVDWGDPTSDVSAATWTISAADMKLEAEQRADTNYNHDVPLVPAAVELLRALRETTGSGDYIFWSGRRPRDPMSENALSFLYKRLGYQKTHVPHGWRSSFSTIMTELYADQPILGVSWDNLIDLMLAHVPVGVSSSQLRYMRAKFAPRRRVIAEQWAELLLDGAVPVQRVVEGPRRQTLR